MLEIRVKEMMTRQAANLLFSDFRGLPILVVGGE